jgi:acyl carrier protein
MSADINARFDEIFHDTINDQVVVHDELSADQVDGWTSLTHINLIYALEDEFGFEFSQSEMAGLANLGELRALVTAKASGELR